MNNIAALYLRLSAEDRDKQDKNDDSLSIENQRIMLTDYANKQGWIIYQIYSDDDYSGSDRDRPAFNQMISDARMKKFNIVLCKTQSRFTRELELVERYIHGLFVELGIRFVSIVDNIDTAVIGNKKTRQINGLINEWYLEDMSDSIKAALHTRMASGKHIGSFAPYGYKKDPDNKGCLIIDEDAAEVVREIFRLYNAGHGRTAIARELNRRGIPNPTGYKIAKGLPYGGTSNRYNCSKIWKYFSVSNILTNEVYIGNLVQGKYYNPTYKSKHSSPAPKDRWIRVEHTHEPIIDMDTWMLTRKLWDERSTPAYQGDINMFSGKLVCAECGYNLRTCYSGKESGVRYFQCNTHVISKESCSGVCVSQPTIENAILSELRKLHDELYDPALAESNILDDNMFGHRINKLDQEIKEITSKQESISKCIRNLYVDKVKEVITEDQFNEFMNDFNAESKTLAGRLTAAKTEKAYLEHEAEHAKTKRELIDEYYNLEHLSKSACDLLIDKIEVGGTRRDRKIVLHWNF